MYPGWCEKRYFLEAIASSATSALFFFLLAPSCCYSWTNPLIQARSHPPNRTTQGRPAEHRVPKSGRMLRLTGCHRLLPVTLLFDGPASIYYPPLFLPPFAPVSPLIPSFFLDSVGHRHRSPAAPAIRARKGPAFPAKIPPCFIEPANLACSVLAS